MRLLAVSVVVLAGVVMAAAGVVAENLPSTRTRNNLEEFGLALTGLACVLFVLEWLAGRRAGGPGGWVPPGGDAR